MMTKKQKRELERLAQEDHCTICGEPFAHLDISIGGLDSNRTVV
jgi:hypothetical protein